MVLHPALVLGAALLAWAASGPRLPRVVDEGEGWVETPDTCAKHADPEYRAWCEHMLPGAEGNRMNREMLESLLRGCEWSAETMGLPKHDTSWTVGPIHDLLGKFDYRPISSPRLEQTWCLHGGEWFFSRVGPVVTTGGNDWTQTTFTMGHPSLPERMYVTAAFVGSTDNASRLLDFPPIHQHHWHLVQNGTTKYMHELIAHGDSDCPLDEGGVGCHVRLFPKGYAMRMRTPLTGWSEVNDVRPAGSAPLEHWFTVALRYERNEAAAPKPLTLFTSGHITHADGEAKGHANTFHVPGDRPSHLWSAASYSPMDGRVVWTWWHNHAQWTRRVTMFNGVTAEQLGLLEPGMPAYHVAQRGDLGDDLLAKLLSRAKAIDGVTICTWDRDVVQADIINGTAELGNRFYRFYSSCRPFNLTRAKQMSYVLFGQYSPESPAVARPLVWMHSILRVLVSANDYDLPSIGCCQKPQWPEGYTPPALDDPILSWRQTHRVVIYEGHKIRVFEHLNATGKALAGPVLSPRAYAEGAAPQTSEAPSLSLVAHWPLVSDVRAASGPDLRLNTTKQPLDFSQGFLELGAASAPVQLSASVDELPLAWALSAWSALAPGGTQEFAMASSTGQRLLIELSPGQIRVRWRNQRVMPIFQAPAMRAHAWAHWLLSYQPSIQAFALYLNGTAVGTEACHAGVLRPRATTTIAMRFRGVGNRLAQLKLHAMPPEEGVSAAAIYNEWTPPPAASSRRQR